ncbi:MFS transporter [Polymorphobacter fuscus]|uniref:MFS transporter n=1 Tax=Sandarakinorhabdus fusca TaxID=1439888 RepID=A0A7C9GRC1_9SPHN|nr:MFS transporter [Polymorphobacter fuscus]KAB7644359.1 MFS transporter [Polymorphobacter fuscus]MQT18276.1 MFS transporter [Polymorphobacter fuscus]NJC08170.1 MFS family permease [Polymorphobacter fuscus]
MANIPAPFRIANYRAFWAARFMGTIASMMLVIVIGWQVYDIARATMSPRDAAFLLGMVGLVQFVPMFSLTLVVGVIADRVDRRHIARAATALELGCAAALAWLVLHDDITIRALFVVAFLFGVARAFAGPSLSALAPNLVPRAILPSAIALNSISWQAGAVAGPPLGAFLYAAAPAIPYLTAAGLFTATLIALFRIGPVPRPEPSTVSPWRSLVEGLGYVRNNRIVLGAISLDLFAVLLGGATAMLPVYARDVLHVGVEGLGPLRAAPAVGAALTALVLAFRPLSRRVGPVMFVCVGLFGVATIVFGLSTDIRISLAALVVLGAADMISMYVRASLIQLHTPDSMRGRVSSVSMLFVSASNELGEFESGVTAAWLGPEEAVVAGGIGAIIVTFAWAWGFPELRRADRFDVPEPRPVDMAGDEKPSVAV